MKIKSLLISLGVAASLSTIVATAQDAPLDAKASDPVTMQWMVGSPPPADRIIRFSDSSAYTFPQFRWSFSHFREFVPTHNISRGNGAPSKLKTREDKNIDSLTFLPQGSETPMSWAESLDANYTDSILVMHKGRIVYEKYFGVATPEKPHMSFSMTKSYFGTMIAMLVEEGQIDTSKLVSHYLPELTESGFGDATVQQLLDMTVGIEFNEDYADPEADIYKFAYAGGFFPVAPDYPGPRNFYDYLKTLKKEGEHGQKFKYQSVDTEVLGWIIKRVTGKPAEDMFSERIWKKLGAEHDAYIVVDSIGTGFAAGGLNTTLRDHARFGEMMRNNGRYNRQQIVPKSVVDDIRKGASTSDFEHAKYNSKKGYSYHNQWWISHNENGAYAASGIHGQTIYIDPTAKMVIVRFASHPIATNRHIDATSLPAYQAVADHLMGRRK